MWEAFICACAEKLWLPFGWSAFRCAGCSRLFRRGEDGSFFKMPGGPR